MAGTTEPTVYKWISRYEQYGIDGLSDRVSSGRPPEISNEVKARILALTRQSPPEKIGLSHWSSREMARYLKLYLGLPMDAVVLSIDKKSQVQALDRTQPLLPMTFAKTEKRIHDYVRHGTTNLFAALNTATGEVVGRCFPVVAPRNFSSFQVAATYDSQQIYVVLDNLSTHSGADVNKWLTRHPNVTFHFTPAGSSWLNQVETWFGIITKQAIRRGTFGSPRQLINTINDYIENWNHDSRSFTWTATANEIITKVHLVHQDFKNLLDNNDNAR